MASAADVPGKYDVVIDGHGYVFLDALTPSVPFRTHRAVYTASPTFIERQNVSGAYGDTQQAFWLTSAQKDWSLGEGQRFFRANDEDSTRKFWQGDQVNGIDTPGQIGLGIDAQTVSFPANVRGVIAASGLYYTVSTTNLYSVTNGGVVTDLGAHGAGIGGLASFAYDGRFLYISSTSSTKIRKYDIAGAAFTDFCATQGGENLLFQNNSLYSTKSGQLYVHDTGGVPTSLFTWKGAEGTATTVAGGYVLAAFGGQVLVLAATNYKTELWSYDGTGVAKIAAFAPGFVGYAMTVIDGIVFVHGVSVISGLGFRTEIYYYANDTTGKLWQSPVPLAGAFSSNTPICDFCGALAFSDDAAFRMMVYRLDTGAVQEIGALSNQILYLASNPDPSFGQGTMMLLNQANSAIQWGRGVATTGTVTSSLFDFDSSLTKTMRGITVDWTPGVDGNGGSVDISYQIGSLDGSWTSLQVGAVSGQEYQLNTNGRSIAVRVTLNKGTSTYGPVVKRVYVRASPIQQSFRQREYILDLTGSSPNNPRRLRDGTPDPTNPHDGVVALITALQSTSPISITDRFGSFTGIVEPADTEFYEMHAENDQPAKSGSFVVKVTVREV